jgi:hypothetical protein
LLRLAEFKNAGGALRQKTSHIEQGDTYKWLWFGYDDTSTEEREILLANGWDNLQFSFSGGCIVSVSIKQEEGETICELVQDMPMEEEDLQQGFYIGCGGGWTFYLVNLKSVFLCTQAVLPGMRARKWGRIVNISSGAARGAGAIGPHYNASKAGMEGLTRGYAARLVKEGITVNNVAPSLIETDMMRGRTDLARNIPLGRMGQAAEVAQAVTMVLGNGYMTGQTIVLNGGMSFI